MQVLIAVASVIGGLVVSFLLYWALNAVVAKLPRKHAARLLPYVFIGPVLVLITVFLVYPTVRTFVLSFMDRRSENFVGWANYQELFSTPDFYEILGNNLMWILVVPISSVVLGLAVATLADRMGPRREQAFKSTIFLPMAISFVAAATIWRFIYSYEAPGQTQTGVLNAIWVALTNSDPVPWMTISEFNINDLLIMLVVIWLNTGFAMVLLSAAIKGVPEETIEAAKIDGANSRSTFFLIVVPQIRGTIVAVLITILIGVMKIFDIVFAMTSGDFGTSVLGMEFIKQLFEFGNPGKASAVVAILMIAIIPVMVYQVRTNRRQEELR